MALKEQGGVGLASRASRCLDSTQAFAKQFSEALKLGANRQIERLGTGRAVTRLIWLQNSSGGSRAIRCADGERTSGTFWGNGELDGVARLVALTGRFPNMYALIITVGKHGSHFRAVTSNGKSSTSELLA